MDKRNHQDSLERNRQEINSENSSALSRRAYREPKNQKDPKRRNLLLPSLFFVFILIPVSILIYVAFFYVPDDTLTGAKNENEVSVESTSPSGKSDVLVPENIEEEEAIDAAEDEKSKETDAKKEEKKVEKKEEEKEKIVKEEPAEEPKEVEEPVETETPAAPEEPAEEANTAVKTVVVQEKETLYRIAVNNYGASGAGAAVEKIKQANNLGSNEIYPGQTLILP